MLAWKEGVTNERVDAGGKRSYARVAGLIYLLYFLAAVGGHLLVSKGFTQPGRITNLFSVLLYIGLGVLLYRLFWPAARWLSLVAMLFNFAGSAVTLSAMFREGKSSLSPLLFFGTYCLLTGVLILRSSFLPRALGLLNAAAGIGWFFFLIPLHLHWLTVSIQIFGFLAEAALMFWLLAMGVDERKWAAAALVTQDNRQPRRLDL